MFDAVFEEDFFIFYFYFTKNKMLMLSIS